MAQGIVEDTLYLDIDYVKRLENGNYKLNSYFSQESFEVLNETYTHDNGQFIYSKTTKVGYGLRTWYVCPSCFRNTKRLYKPIRSSLWKCRKCHQLVYMKSRLSGNEFEYVTYRIRQIQDMFDMTKSYSLTNLTDTSIENVPLFKPKYMRQKKFEALREELEWLIWERVRLWMAMC